MHNEKAFSGFSVKDLEAAKKFYGEVLGVEVEVIPAGLQLKIGNGIMIYPKENHEPATRARTTSGEPNAGAAGV